MTRGVLGVNEKMFVVGRERFCTKSKEENCTFNSHIMSASKSYQISTRVGGLFAIPLGGCYTCGYSWELQYDLTAIGDRGESTQCPAVAVPGASCVHIRQFRALKPGQHVIRGWFYRKFEVAAGVADKGPVTTWTIHVQPRA